MKHPLTRLLEHYTQMVVLDTETSGLGFEKEEIIQLSAVVYRLEGENLAQQQAYDQLIAMTPGKVLNPFITNLTGITQENLAERGIAKEQACADLAAMLVPGTLFVAYNAHFDLSFVYHLLRKHGDFTILRNCDFLDALTIYRDRKEFPHKLANAIEAYDLSDKVVNSHCAIDDVYATAQVLMAMAQERDDLLEYVNLFGFNPKYGVEGKQIKSIQYQPQRYNSPNPLYF